MITGCRDVTKRFRGPNSWSDILEGQDREKHIANWFVREQGPDMVLTMRWPDIERYIIPDVPTDSDEEQQALKGLESQEVRESGDGKSVKTSRSTTSKAVGADTPGGDNRQGNKSGGRGCRYEPDATGQGRK